MLRSAIKSSFWAFDTASFSKSQCQYQSRRSAQLNQAHPASQTDLATTVPAPISVTGGGKKAAIPLLVADCRERF
jgi:hypothetical protein